MKNGAGKIKEYEYCCFENYFYLAYEGEYLNGKGMEKEKNIIIMVIYYLKGNIKMEKETEKEKNITMIVNY